MLSFMFYSHNSIVSFSNAKLVKGRIFTTEKGDLNYVNKKCR